MVHVVEDFYGVYLLYNVNPRYKGRTYIGYTVDPNRRIKQHNLGRHAGGAGRTDGKGPWEMVLIVHGFPNDISGLRFEWAWQHPEKSRRLRHVARKGKKELQFDFRFRVLSEMLRAAPWNRLSLTVRWLKQEYQRDFVPSLAPPLHMAIAYGLVKSKKVKPDKKKGSKSKEDNSVDLDSAETDLPSAPSRRHKRCAVCTKVIQPKADDIVTCYQPKCTMTSHITCLSKSFLSSKREESLHLLPVEGTCPRCQKPLLWGDIIRHKHGCYQNLEEVTEADEGGSDHWADELQTQQS